MITRNIDIPTPDGICDAFVAYPDENRSYPGVIFCMDAIGLRPYLYEMAEKLAAQGCYVLLPNLFYRNKRSPLVNAVFPVKAEGMQDVIKQIMPFFQTFSVEKTMADIDTLIEFLGNQKQVRKSPMGITGYCLGGSIAIRSAARHPERFAAVASFHSGNLATEAPDSPHTLLPRMKAELYIAHADQDQSMPPEQIKRLKEALEATKLHYKMELYQGASHGFTMADLPAGNPDALKRHWEELFALFKRNLGTHESTIR